MTYKEQLQCKALIVMEGNDLATGLRWSLLSRSVVMMPPPERTSWAMEEWLEPWTHYIPLNRNLTNVEEMVQWIRDNDKEARQIAERGTLFAYDLVLHPNAKKDDDDVKREILRRYRQFFVPGK
uniref:Glycosyl transferase CAP10 domain-containing protein n=1 Tax=Minutocellus polymorphus TaxID=265543 RepID=A0A7S0AEY8_9STRA